MTENLENEYKQAKGAKPWVKSQSLPLPLWLSIKGK